MFLNVRKLEYERFIWSINDHRTIMPCNGHILSMVLQALMIVVFYIINNYTK